MSRHGLTVALVAACIVAPAATADRGDFGDETSRVQYGRDRSVDVEHYKLDVRFDHERSEVAGTVSVTLTPLNDGLTTIELDAGPMEIESVTLEAIEAPQELFFRHDGERLDIDLPRPYAADEIVTVHVRYRARPRAGLYFVGPDEGYPEKPRQVWSQGESEDNRYWFPSFDYPNDKATFEELYTVPASWTAVGNGELLEVIENAGDGTRTFHYSMEVPNVAYLVSVVAGEFERYAESYEGKPVEYFVPPGTGRETAMRSFGRTTDMLGFFSAKIGIPYPYAKYSQACAVDFIYGGMENVSATTQTAETLHDATAALEVESHGLVAHEAAHQWFGDLLTCADWSHAWLNEGFATYWEKLWWEHAFGPDEFAYRMLQDRESYLTEDRERYRRPIVQKSYTDPMDLFDSHLYPKGGWVLHMLRGVLGDDGFFKAIRHYARTHQGKVVETTDLRRAIADATGVNLEGFFDQWLRRGGHPEIRVTRDWSADDNELTLHFRQTQTVDALTPLFEMPVTVEVDTAEGTVRRTLRLRHSRQDLTLRLPGEPMLVRIDPEFRVLMELDHERPDAEILFALAADPNPAGRIFAARDVAARLSRALGTPSLAACLEREPFWGVRVEIAEALGKLGGPAARDALRAALDDDDARVRKAVVTALGEFDGDKVAAEALVDVFENDGAYGPRAAAVPALAKLGAPQIAAVANRALRTDSYNEVIRSSALEALAELGSDRDLKVIREWTAYGKPARARRAALKALAEHPGASEERDTTVELVIALLDDPQVFMRESAIEALGELGATAGVEALKRSARVEADSRLRRAARRSLRLIREAEKDGRGLPELAAEVERLREENREQALRIEKLERDAERP